MLRTLLTLALFVALFAFPSETYARKAKSFQGNVSWEFDSREDRDGNPQTRVYLKVGARRVFVIREMAQFSVLERKDYSTHEVPQRALTACFSWWAGGGSQMYVVRRGRQLVIYRRSLDEQVDTEPYVRFKTIPVR
jgi:hypothetical protein